MNPQEIQADYLLHPRWIVPMVPYGVVLEGHSVALSGDRISAILPRAESLGIAADEVVDLPSHAVLPGLINSHGHAGMSLLRGYADDLPLMPWLEQHIWPAEKTHASEQFAADGMELAIAEMVRSGTTTFCDQFVFPDVGAATAQRLGMRCQIAFPVWNFPTRWASDTDEYISKGLAVHDQFKHSTLVSVVFGPHAPYTVAEDDLARVATLASELDTVIHIHLHETAAEILQAMDVSGERPISTLHRLGLLGPRTQCVHMTALIDEDIDLLVSTGAHVVHCPQSNMKLASGICPVSDLRAKGVNVAIGTDSAASNNDLNLFGEMQTAALLAKLHGRDATALPAADALHLATLGGARALGREDALGSLEVGKLADVIAVDLSGPETQPVYNPVSQLVYACNGSQVTHSWIAGEAVMWQRELKYIDLAALGARIGEWHQRISATKSSTA
ncbi:MAG: TRZ/ATZ family hydrolase [Halioglobus sp.]|nr:TRZ/ATZ family hydrolase [Halioglobus sp.]